MEKLDLKAQFKALYNPSTKVPVLVEVPPMNYLTVDGEGAPDGPAAQAAIETLYNVAYTLKFSIKKSKEIDYPVMALEGLWWSSDMSDFSMGDKSRWKWTYMIMQPGLITKEMVKSAVDEVRRKKNPLYL